MTHTELLAQVKKIEQRIALAKETFPSCGCSEKTIQRRRVASAYLSEAGLLAKEVYDEIELQEGERLVKVVAGS